MNLLVDGFGWVLDIVFFVVILLGTAIGAARGFVKGIMRVAGWLFSLAFAFFFCMPLRTLLEDSFGLTTALWQAIGGPSWLADVLSAVICFVALFVLVKLCAWFLGKAGTALVNKSNVARGINKFLGALLGLVKAVIVLFILLMIAKWIDDLFTLTALGNFIRSSFVVGKIYDWSWFVSMTKVPGKFIGEAAMMYTLIR